MNLSATINGREWRTDHAPGESLLSALRSGKIYGPKKGCEAGDCGCCTVWLEGKAIQACLLPAFRAEGKKITTIEGLTNSDGGQHKVVKAFLREEGFQCGYCTAGMIMTQASENGQSACVRLEDRLKGNICRCTGWSAIARACGDEHENENISGQGGVGASVPNRHGPDLVSGAPSFTADFPEAALLHLAALRSPHPHARIKQIDTREAAALRGVVAIFTHLDIKRIPYSTGCHPGTPRDAFDTYLLDERVRFVGQRVAIVAAETKIIAQQACEKIFVQYEILPHVTEPEDAIREGAPVIHPELDSFKILDPQRNLVGVFQRERGSVTQGFAEADFIVERNFKTHRQQHTHLEPHVSTAWMESDGSLVVRSSTQVPFLVRKTLSRILEIPEEKIRVFKPRVGGGFGNKQEVQTEDLCAFVALKTGRPAQWEFSRTEEFIATTTRHPMQLKVRCGAKRDGTITAFSLDFTTNTGAYGNHSVDVLECASTEAMEMFDCPNKSVSARAIYTNTVPAGAFRGYGATQTTYALECTIDDLAHELDLDPWELRKKNLVKSGSILSLGDQEDDGHFIGSYALDDCLAHVRRKLAEHVLPKSDDSWKYGSGFAVAGIGCGLPVVHRSGACIRVTGTGYRVEVGTADIGTASDTTLAQVAAETLGVDFRSIELVSGDTDGGVPHDSGAYASATTYIAGRAVQLAAEKLRADLCARASRALDIPPDKLCLVGSSVSGNGKSILVSDLALNKKEGLFARVDNFVQPRVAFSFAVVGIQLRVNAVTGKIELLRCIQALDAGRLLNPRVCLGQAEGATVQSLGFALTENLVIGADGVIENPSFRDYRVPALADIPPIETRFFESIDVAGPFGAKAIGELTTNAAPAAVANAIRNAIGTRIHDLPITPEKVWRALTSARKPAGGPAYFPLKTA